jgi:hypothetical protein
MFYSYLFSPGWRRARALRALTPRAMNRAACLTLSVLLLCSAAAARAGEPPKADLSFDLLDDDKDPERKKDAELQRSLQSAQVDLIDRQVRVRRGLLVAHQAFGFATLGALAATLVIGQLNYVDKYASGDFTTRYERSHLGLGVTTTALFATTGILALSAPNPYPKPVRLDTALVHKLSMAMATVGMITQIILGPVTAARVGRLDQPNLALGHLITGYATFAFMATGVVAYFF